MQNEFKEAKEYKDSMKKISLSDSDKARILANVKKAYEESSDTVVSMKSRPRFSTRQMGMVAAALVVLIAGAVFVRSQFLVENDPGNVDDPVIIADSEEEIWEELASVDDIARETDCRTYTLSNVSKSYKVNKVEVAKKQKHVKITYNSEKHMDEILLEYKEEENASAITEQFSEQNELKKEKVGDKEVTMYGDKECDAMTWQQESCTFAVTLSKSCSTVKAARLVSGTKETKTEEDEPKGGQEKDTDRISKSAVGWEGDEKESTAKQRRKVLNEVFELYGFRVMIQDPAEKVAYKIVDNFESFSFSYPELEELEKRRIVGYAGRGGSPDGILEDFEEDEMISVNGISVQIYVNENGEEIYTFTKRDINFTILVGEVSVEDKSMMLSGLISVIHISLESGQTEVTEEEKAEEDEPEEDEPEADDNVEQYQEEVQSIQYAVADGDLKKLSAYIEFPLAIKGLDIMVASAKEFQSLDASMIFSSAWVDSIAAYDTAKIRSSTKTITMGSGNNYLTCKLKKNFVLITEISIETEEPEEPTDSLTEEE